MKFVQIVEYHTTRPGEIDALDEEWRRRTDGVRPSNTLVIGADRDRPDTFIAVLTWDSYEDAQRNNELGATHDLAKHIADLCTEPPRYRNLDVITDRS
jgi:hypothetical protein